MMSINSANSIICKVEEKRRLIEEYLVEYGTLLDATITIKTKFDSEIKTLFYDSAVQRQKMIECAYVVRILDKLISEIKCFLVDCNPASK